MATMTMDELLRQWERQEIWFTTPENTVFEALQKMADHNIGALCVMEDEKLLGVFSERDYARKIIKVGECLLDAPVSQIMTSEMVTISPEKTLEEAMTMMTEYHIRHLPVLDGDKLLGMVSIRDLVRAMLEIKENEIDSLSSYIEGTEYGKK